MIFSVLGSFSVAGISKIVAEKGFHHIKRRLKQSTQKREEIQSLISESSSSKQSTYWTVN